MCSPAPPLGTHIGQIGINIAAFVKVMNCLTKRFSETTISRKMTTRKTVLKMPTLKTYQRVLVQRNVVVPNVILNIF